jgi:hypothetical protein
MLQNDGEPTWQGKTYNALKDKKHLTGINKEEVKQESLCGMWPRSKGGSGVTSSYGSNYLFDNSFERTIWP